MKKLHPAYDVDWYVIVDDTVGGKAIGTADKPLSQYKPEEGEIVLAHWINEGFAGHMVMLHNVWLAEKREVEKLGDAAFHTYKPADDSLVYGEYSFMTTDDTWTNGELDEPVDVIHEVWECVQREQITYKPDWWDESRAEDDDAIDLADGDGSGGDDFLIADSPRLGDL
jgi:hypothetical protein